MGELADRRLLVAARADFLEGIDPHLHGVPELVAASWRRSRSSGVQPDEVSSESSRTSTSGRGSSAAPSR
jgi:hypothetical protein